MIEKSATKPGSKSAPSLIYRPKFTHGHVKMTSLQVEVVLAPSLSATDKATIWKIFADAMQGM
jgi:hypothetical protein